MFSLAISKLMRKSAGSDSSPPQFAGCDAHGAEFNAVELLGQTQQRPVAFAPHGLDDRPHFFAVQGQIRGRPLEGRQGLGHVRR